MLGAQSTPPADPDTVEASALAAESPDAANPPKDAVQPQVVTNWTLTRPAKPETFDPFEDKPATVSYSMDSTGDDIQC